MRGMTVKWSTIRAGKVPPEAESEAREGSAALAIAVDLDALARRLAGGRERFVRSVLLDLERASGTRLAARAEADLVHLGAL